MIESLALRRRLGVAAVVVAFATVLVAPSATADDRGNPCANPSIAKHSDTIVGTTGDDRIDARGGSAVTIFALAGDDLACGSNGSDRLFGEAGTDNLYGGSGTDSLSGGTDDDTLL